MSKEIPTPLEIRSKLEHYCAYQDRCHQEVTQKLRSYGVSARESDEIIAHLIAYNFLNEERFACSFARGRHRIKHWGKIRIVNELKFRGITQYNINTALKEITPEMYAETFYNLSDRLWESLRNEKGQKKNKKFCDYLLRKGFESTLVYDRLKELNKPA